MALEGHVLRTWLRLVASGEASRRDFIRTMLGLGLSGPLIVEMLTRYAPARAQETKVAQRTFTPSKRGGGGKLRLLYWNAPTILNAHFAAGARDVAASRVVYEPLFSIDADGEFIPVLAEEIPSVENGGRSPDGVWTIWRLKQGVVWHDGEPFTADDVIFTWEYATDLATATTSRGQYENIRRIDKLDAHTIKVVFANPAPRWYEAGRGQILPRHLFAEYKGPRAREAPYNLKPVGTGPYKIVAFRPGDVALYEINRHYHVPNRPFFDTVELKGGGDASSAARAVIQSGEFDFAWNTQIEKDVMERLERHGRRGTFRMFPGTSVEHIKLNRTDPWTEVDGERSSVKAPHPFFSDTLVRQAFAAAIDRRSIAEQLYGVAGQPTSNFLNAPRQFRSPNTRWEFDLDKAARLLEQAGWKRGSDGIRHRDGRRMKVLFQTSANPVRQKTQAIVKNALERIGIEVELKAVPANVFFASDPGNPDTYSHFYADMQMAANSLGFDPQGPMRFFVSWEIAQKANNWAGRNSVRWANAEYDRLWKQAETEMDPVKRAALFIRMNDLLIEEVVVIPVVWRQEVSAVSHTLRGLALSPWDSILWDLAFWYREA
ncbi:MAG TPA: peptide ABC transporter substrate-binding protein [Candidatus Tectomicrobia bacterium]|nr:peptide ABC transporter substrate-binding protein [Candidatus Tectomicrobia bacterium]